MQKRNVLVHLGIIVIVSMSVSVALNVLLLLIDLPQYSERYQEVSEILYAPPFRQQLFTSGLLIPIMEEIIFRGLGFRLLRRWLAFPWAMMISALVFGVYHGNLVQFVYATICGVLLAYLYEKYDTVIAPIISHMAMNIIALIFTQTGTLSWIMEDNFKAIISVLLCLGVGVFCCTNPRNGCYKNVKNILQRKDG